MRDDGMEGIKSGALAGNTNASRSLCQTFAAAGFHVLNLLYRPRKEGRAR